jgi:hypothetical protein
MHLAKQRMAVFARVAEHEINPCLSGQSNFCISRLYLLHNAYNIHLGQQAFLLLLDRCTAI